MTIVLQRRPGPCHAREKKRPLPACRVRGKDIHDEEAWRAGPGFTWWEVYEKDRFIPLRYSIGRILQHFFLEIYAYSNKQFVAQ